jgi:hypothetical protein
MAPVTAGAPGAPYGIGRYKTQKRKLRQKAQHSLSPRERQARVSNAADRWDQTRIIQSLEWALM